MPSRSSKTLPSCLVPLQHHQHQRKQLQSCLQWTSSPKFLHRFQGIGQFPHEYNIKLCDNAQPVIHVPRKCPISICTKVKAELDKMVKLGVITPVDESTDWVSSVAYALKESGELHPCLDPCDLNNAICRDHHHTPTVDDIPHEFAHSKYFTELDTMHGYWAVIFDSKYSLITTFNTLYGQYHFLSTLCPSLLLGGFQKRMYQILEECEGCIGIADDITVYDCTEAKHDAHLWKFMEVAWKYGLVSNSMITQVKAQMVKFFRCLHDESGVQPGTEKVDAVHALSTPTTITELWEFLGMVTYLSPSFLVCPP